MFEIKADILRNKYLTLHSISIFCRAAAVWRAHCSVVVRAVWFSQISTQFSRQIGGGRAAAAASATSAIAFTCCQPGQVELQLAISQPASSQPAPYHCAARCCCCRRREAELLAEATCEC